MQARVWPAGYPERAVVIGPVDVDYGDDNSCEPLDVLKHLTSEYLQDKFAKS